jgi:glycosyltransferase involved in cell wall biosynthesis
MKTNIFYPKNIVYDERKSMDLYLNLLLDTLDQNKFKSSVYQPKFTNYPFLSTQNKKRLNRLFSYKSRLKKNDFDILHIVDHSYSHLIRYCKKTNSIVTVHDIIPILRKKSLIKSNEYRRPYLFDFSLKYLNQANCIVAVSNFTKKTLVENLGINEDKITVIHNAIDNDFFKYKNIKRKKNLKKTIDIIIFGNNEFYKNNLNSIKACSHFNNNNEKKIKIFCVGKLSEDCNELINSKKINCEIIHLNNIPKNDLINLYLDCDLLLFPSIFEGFGLPLIEALAIGLPVIASNIEVIKEICGDHVTYCDPFSINDISQKIKNFDFKNHDSEKGYIHAKKYNIDVWAKEYSNIYESLT